MIVVFFPPVLKPFALLTSGPAPWDRGFMENVAEGSAMRQIQLTILGLVGIGFLALRRKDRSTWVAPNIVGWLLAGFAALILASVLWTDERTFFLRRLVALAMLALAAFAFRSMSREEMIRLVFFTTLAVLAFGLAKEVARGTFHPWDPGYRFAGTLSHPNLQGLNCALLFLSGLSLVQGLRRWRLRVALAIPFACLLLTRSRTSLAALLGAALFYVFLSLLRGRPLVLAAWLCLAATAAVSAAWIGKTSRVVEDTVSLGREDSELVTLQGRTDIWREAFVFVRARPMLGFGYDAFWSEKHIVEFSNALGWRIVNAHSTYLDMLLGIGAIGLLVFVCLLGLGIWRATKVAVWSGSSADSFTATLLVFCALHSFLETTIVGPSFLTLLYLTAIARIGFPAQAPVGGTRVH
jgi:exopolysaccharide production protein ExoQ